MIQLGIFAKTFIKAPGGTLYSKIEESGITNIHFNMACAGLPSLPQSIPPEVITEIEENARLYQLDIIGISATFNMIHPSVEERNKGILAFEAIAEAANRLGVSFLSLCTGSRNPEDKWAWHPENNSKEAWKALYKSLEETILMAEKYQLTLGIEPEHGNIIQNSVLARTLLRELQSQHVGIILDPANLFETSSTKREIRYLISKAVDILGPDIIQAHAKDRSLDGMIMPAGKGAVDFPFFIDRLLASGFQGPLVLHGLASDEVLEARDYLKSCLS